MATYGKGFKKQTGDQILLKAIVAIIVVVLVVVGAVWIYDLATDKGNYTDFDHIDAYDEILGRVDDTSTAIDEYLVYFYNAEDEDCLEIQKKVLNLAEDLEKDGVIIYFVDLDDIAEDTTGDKDAFLLAIGKGTSFLNLSPMLISIADGDFNTAYTGTDNVVNVLEQVQDGEYTPIN
jgi:thiol-disulfide isomerase/thioredoxin